MPELPEVETIRQQLVKKIKNQKILEIRILDKKLINQSEKSFVKNNVGSIIKNIQRKGKLLILNLSNQYNLAVHLKLTGQLLLVDKKRLPEKHTRAVLVLSKDKLFFNDFRRFGYFKLLNREQLEKQELGIDPLSRTFTLKIFKDLLSKKINSKIKPLLMDQSFLAGIGNIYAQEACFYAYIKPDRLVKNLNKKEIKNLYLSLRKILVNALKHKGSSVENFLDIYGRPGGFVPLLKVYNRKGEKCLRCKRGIIQEIKIGGRGTRYCSRCQK